MQILRAKWGEAVFLQQIDKIEECYRERCQKYSRLMSHAAEHIDSMEHTIGELLKYIYCEMPLGDLSEAEEMVFLDYALQSKQLMEQVKRVRGLPEEIFLDYVLHPKASEEEMDICRTAFCHLFWEYFKRETEFLKTAEPLENDNVFVWLDEHSAERVANEVNYWCFSEAAICEGNGRMVSARTVFASAQGNAEEFMSFVVQALRSVGIPAKISDSCDGKKDVQIWVDQEWKVLHALEPWMDTEQLKEYADIPKDSLSKIILTRKARVQGQQFVKRKNWRNEDREKFFFGDINTMNMRAKLLKMMPEKDQLDMKFDVMEKHFRYAMEFQKDYDEELFVSCVLNPRIAEEKLTDWRTAIREAFGNDELEKMKKEPAAIYKIICEKYEAIDQNVLGKVYVSPTASIRLGKVTEISAMIMAVAAARLLNIPARFNFDTKKGEYWNGTAFSEFQ